MNAISRWAKIALVAAVLVLSGCAGLPPGMEAPSVTVSDIGFGGASSLFEQQFNLKLRIQNPNNTELKIDGIAFSLEINDKPFASGVGNQAVTVPRFASGFVPVEAYSSLGGMVRQISSFLQNDQRATRYRIKGTMSLAGGLKIPFDRGGEFDLGAFTSK